jgi:hypothetical protein
MDRFKNIVGFYFTFSLLLLGLPANLQAVDFNNTQVDQEVYEQAISWENLQDRNGVIFAPNAEEPLTGYIRKLYPNTQVEVLVRLSLGLVDQVSRWKPNGIPLYSVEVIPGGFVRFSQFLREASNWTEVSLMESRVFGIPQGRVCWKSDIPLGKGMD